MVGFHDQGVAPSQGMPDLRGGLAQVRGDAEAQSGRGVGHGHRYGIGRVVDRDEGIDSQPADVDWKSRRGSSGSPHCRETAFDTPGASFRHQERGAVGACEDAGAPRVIAVFVRQYDGGDGGRFHADHREPVGELTSAEARVDENARVTGAHEHRVAPASAAQNREPHAVSAPAPIATGQWPQRPRGSACACPRSVRPLCGP